MTQPMPKRLAKIPVTLINGEWKALDGSQLEVSAGANAVLVIDPMFLVSEVRPTRQRERDRRRHLILDPGTTLLVTLAINDPDRISPELKRHLITVEQVPGTISPSTSDAWRLRYVHFVAIELSRGEGQEYSRRNRTPGLWLRIYRGEAKDMTSNGVLVPREISEIPLGSLNQAFTRLSEAYEPWRQSHTGNAYTRILYQESNGIWFPLDDLRTAGPESHDHPLAQHRWREILSAKQSH